jgi:serine phosphatase RsbU (regulator of sigma subunit)
MRADPLSSLATSSPFVLSLPEQVSRTGGTRPVDRFTAVERAVRRAAPHALLDAAANALTASYGATEVRLLLADYALATLRPVDPLPYRFEPVPVHSSAAGRAFDAQRTCTEGEGRPGRADLAGRDRDDAQVTVHLPISVRGDRIGVLTVRLPSSRWDPGVRRELEAVAEVLGHEIVVAERDTDFYQQARRADRLTLAAEIQWQLLPARSCTRPEFALGAQLEPAYAIHGDNFDWSASAEHLAVTVTNGMGEGVEAALLTSLAVNALRNARRSGLSLADQAFLGDQAVYGHYRGAVHVAALLCRFELATGRAEIIDAGSPKVWRLRRGKAEPIGLEPQLPLGMFEDTVYTVQHLRMEAGDRLLFASDGVYDVAGAGGERYGERALARALARTRLLPPSQVPKAVLSELATYRAASDSSGPSGASGAPAPSAPSGSSGVRTPRDVEDDAMVVCLDWHGRDT